MTKMSKWYDNIILHPKTHKVLFAYNGSLFLDEQFNTLLKDCVVCETDEIVCYAYYHAIWKRVNVLVVNKNIPDKRFNWLCEGTVPKFKIIDNIIYAKRNSSPYDIQITLSKTGNPFVMSRHSTSIF